MRHRVITSKLGRTTAHRQAMAANLVCSLITERRIRTTLPKAKLARRLAEKMVTLAKKGTLAHRRLALATLRQEAPVRALFQELAPQFAARAGGYTRIIRLADFRPDGADMAFLEWVGIAPVNRRKKSKPAADAKDTKKS
jgi:large subunit ribosomal protein L17